MQKQECNQWAITIGGRSLLRLDGRHVSISSYYPGVGQYFPATFI